MERQKIDYRIFLEHMVRLRNSLSYVEAEKISQSDILGTAALFELRQIYDNEEA